MALPPRPKPLNSAAQHAQDTIDVGSGLVDETVAHFVAAEAAARTIADLENLGVDFDRDADGALKLGREAAHSYNRIIGVTGDRSGRAIMKALVKRAEATPSLISFLKLQPMNWRSKMAVWSAYLPVPPMAAR